MIARWLSATSLAIVAAVVWGAVHPVFTQKASTAMDPYLPLYDFARAKNPMALGWIRSIAVHPGPGDEGETVDIGVQIAEALWQDVAPGPRLYHMVRHRSPLMQARIPDQLWGRVTLEEGVRLFLVFAAGAPRDAPPIYVDQTAELSDPVIPYVRAVLETEKAVHSAPERFQKRLTQLAGNVVEQLFSGQALAGDGPWAPADENRAASAMAAVYGKTPDTFVKVTFGSLLWDSMYQRAERTGKAAIVTATLQVAASGDENARMFALDRIAEADPESVRSTGVKGTSTILALLEDRLRSEPDADVKRHLGAVIQALR